MVCPAKKWSDLDVVREELNYALYARLQVLCLVHHSFEVRIRRTCLLFRLFLGVTQLFFCTSAELCYDMCQLFVEEDIFI